VNRFSCSLVGLLVVFWLAQLTTAGEISGKVRYPDGSIAKAVAVNAKTNGFGGAITKKVYTDSNGRFTLTWSSNADLAKVYVSGNVVERNIKNGRSDVVLILR